MIKLNFIQTVFPSFLKTLSANATGSWGLMNAQQMTEHMAASVRMATGAEKHFLFTPADQVEKYKEFAMSDKAFKENTKNAMLPDTPAPATTGSMTEAIELYNSEVSAFMRYFNSNPGATLMNPIFGGLNFEEWTHLFYKHAMHHAIQFGYNA